jgi:hypothetical protein
VYNKEFDVTCAYSMLIRLGNIRYLKQTEDHTLAPSVISLTVTVTSRDADRVALY